MTVSLSPDEVASRIGEHLPEAVVEAQETAIFLRTEALLDVLGFLKTAPGLDFDFLCSVSAIDYLEYFEIVYHLTSLTHNHRIVLKTKGNLAYKTLRVLWERLPAAIIPATGPIATAPV